MAVLARPSPRPVPDRSVRRPSLALPAALLCGAVLLSACGARRFSPGAESSSSTPSRVAAGPGGGGLTSSTARSVAAGASSSASAPAGAQYAPYYRNTGTATASPGSSVAITANDFLFQPDTLTVQVGTVVRLKVRNVATEAHNFSLPAFGIDAALPAGQTTTITFTPRQRGTYWFLCNGPGHAQAGMVGKLTVV